MAERVKALAYLRTSSASNVGEDKDSHTRQLAAIERYAAVAGVEIVLLKDRGIELIAVDSPDSFVSDTPTAIMVRQILGAVSQFEKAAIVAKLKGARDRKRLVHGKCEGRKSHSENSPETVARAKALRRQNRRTHKRMSLREIAAVLASEGHVSPRSRKAFGPSAVRSMLS
jgi:DNA invertase Pin-like site-specific DNA recombinase